MTCGTVRLPALTRSVPSTTSPSLLRSKSRSTGYSPGRSSWSRAKVPGMFTVSARLTS